MLKMLITPREILRFPRYECERIKKLDAYAFKKKAKCQGRAQSWWRPSQV